MAAGEILEEEVVTQEEEGAVIMTNYQDNSQRSSKEIDENQKRSCRNGVSIEASIDSPRK